MIRQLKWSFLIAVAAMLAASATAVAASVSLSLNLTFNNPHNYSSGGTWFVVGKADERGLAAVSMHLDNVNFNPATGFLAPAQFDVRERSVTGIVINIVEGWDPGNPTRPLDIGVIGSPFPSSYVDTPGLTPILGNPSLGSFTGGVALARGTFNPGVVPRWSPGKFNDANIFSNPAGLSRLQAPVLTTVRAIIPEPATLGLGACAMFGVAAVRRRNA